MNEAVAKDFPRSKKFKKSPIFIPILIAGLAAALLGYFFKPISPEVVNLLSKDITLSYGPRNYAEAIDQDDKQIRLARERVERAPEQWTYQESLAVASLVRGQLNGNFADMLQASKTIAVSNRLAPKGSGPALASAVINLSLHRNQAAAGDIERVEDFAVPPEIDIQAEIEAMKGDVKFYSGDYDAALKLYKTAASRGNGARVTFRLATWYKYNGNFDKAIELYEEDMRAKSARTPQIFAIYLLQIGALELQRGNWKKAKQYFVRADNAFSGYWLARAHVAQMDAVEGNYSAAGQTYQSILKKNENPDVMEALSALYYHQGKTALAKKWSDRAALIWNNRISLLPAAYYDHALDHELAVGNAEKALLLATANHSLRPYGDAKIALARALIANGHNQKAVEILHDVEASGWHGAEQYVTLSDAYLAIDDPKASTSAKKRALSVNPRIFDDRIGLLAFGNH